MICLAFRFYQIQFRPGLGPADPTGGAYDDPQTPSRLGSRKPLPIPNSLDGIGVEAWCLGYTSNFIFILAVL